MPDGRRGSFAIRHNSKTKAYFEEHLYTPPTEPLLEPEKEGGVPQDPRYKAAQNFAAKNGDLVFLEPVKSMSSMAPEYHMLKTELDKRHKDGTLECRFYDSQEHGSLWGSYFSPAVRQCKTENTMHMSGFTRGLPKEIDDYRLYGLVLEHTPRTSQYFKERNIPLKLLALSHLNAADLQYFLNHGNIVFWKPKPLTSAQSPIVKTTTAPTIQPTPAIVETRRLTQHKFIPHLTAISMVALASITPSLPH